MSELPFYIDDSVLDKPKKPMSSVTIMDEDYCPYCHAKTIELYDSKNIPEHYGYLLKCFDKEKFKMTSKFNRTTLAYFRCKICKRKYKIDWSRRYPVPLLVLTKYDL